jgi:hypothetical protein
MAPLKKIRGVFLYDVYLPRQTKYLYVLPHVLMPVFHEYITKASKPIDHGI